jgi:hypothetical protein
LRAAGRFADAADFTGAPGPAGRADVARVSLDARTGREVPAEVRDPAASFFGACFAAWLGDLAVDAARGADPFAAGRVTTACFVVDGFAADCFATAFVAGRLAPESARALATDAATDDPADDRAGVVAVVGFAALVFVLPFTRPPTSEHTGRPPSP